MWWEPPSASALGRGSSAGPSLLAVVPYLLLTALRATPSPAGGTLLILCGRTFPLDLELNLVRLRVLENLESVFIFYVVKEDGCTEQLVPWTGTERPSAFVPLVSPGLGDRQLRDGGERPAAWGPSPTPQEPYVGRGPPRCPGQNTQHSRCPSLEVAEQSQQRRPEH